MLLLKQINEIGIVPVVKIDALEDCIPLAKALIDGGLPCAEITFRTKYAKEAIRIITTTFPNMIVGAGTVLTTSQVDEAIEAGAKFIVSPGLNPKVVQYCLDKAILIIPGCANASDIEQAIELGLNTVKFFPSETLGGLNMIKALNGPYSQMKFMPTGGITENNFNLYLKEDFIVACGGTWMIDQKLINTKDFKAIENLTKQAVMKMLDLSLHHVGIHPHLKAKELADDFASLFGETTIEHENSFFGSQFVEIMKNKTGQQGHIAIGTLNVLRAKVYFENKGYQFKANTARYNQANRLMSIYFEKELNGFALHLVQK